MNALKELSNLIAMFCRISWWHVHDLVPSRNKLRRQYYAPATKIPVEKNIPSITWIGHSTFLICINNLNIITDPIFGSPLCFMPRLVPPGIPQKSLPPIDIIIISHNHRDHLDKKSILSFQKQNPIILVPLGLGVWFKKLGFTNVYEKQWQENHMVEKTKITCLPAAHWSGRSFYDVNKSLCASWMIEYQNKTIYFAGDTRYSSHFSKIGTDFPSITTALMPIAPIEPQKQLLHSHLNHEQVVHAFIDLRAEEFIPMHWGTFQLGLDKIEAPLELLHTTWKQKQKYLLNKKLHILKFGETKKLME